MNSDEPGSSGEITAAANTKTNTQKPGEVDAGKQAASKEHDAASKERAGREAAGRAARQESGIEQALEVGGSGFVVSPFVGGGGRVRRLLLIGLDGATPELALGAWRTELRTLHMLTDRGLRGRLRSSTPWASIPAWLSLLSGLDPGQIGIYGAHPRQHYGYVLPTRLDSQAMREPRLWDILGSAGKHVGVVGAPATTPAPPVYGHLIGDDLGVGESAIYPPTLRQQVATWLEDEPPARLADDEVDRIVGSAYMRAEQRFRLARRLLARDTYDCFVLYDDGIATVQRALWHTLDTTHQRFRPNHPSAGVISGFYRFIDEQIADLLELIDDNTVVGLTSACGTQALDSELALNDWLIAQGDLVLRARPERPATLAECEVDWERTRAWAEADGAIYLNIAGRDAQGAIPSAQADAAAEDLAARLRALPGPASTNAPHVTGEQTPALEVYRPASLYAATRGIAPDLLAVCTQPGWRPSDLIGRGSPWVDTGATPMDAACESPSGLFVIYDPQDLGGGRELAGATIYDIVPTLLALLDQPIPARLRGRALIER
ncbi:MAG TPA: alkaline phosphatase family protein [Roseiflexaceae bacterium]|nr:alkaline phosphatase family protein [Roseiflexaceae bacterium]